MSETIQFLAIIAIPLLFGITLHEVAHGWMALRHGDHTAERMGRLTLNPLKHIDPIGTVVLPVALLLMTGFMFGWAKPVPVNPQGMRNPKRDMIAVAFAGPGANVLMAFGWALFYKLIALVSLDQQGVAFFLQQMARYGFFFNMLLAVFNLLPIPPLDGGRVLRGLAPDAFTPTIDALERYGLIIVVALLLLGGIRPIFRLVDASMGIFGLPQFSV